MGTRATRPLMYRDANGNVFQHMQDDDYYVGFFESGTIRYHGFARAGKPKPSQSDAVWRIARETLGAGLYDSGETVEYAFADASNDYDNVWDDSTAFTITALTKANPGEVTTSTDHGFVDGDKIYITGCDATEANSNTYTILRVSATKFTIGTNTAAWAIAGTTGSCYRRTMANEYTY